MKNKTYIHFVILFLFCSSLFGQGLTSVQKSTLEKGYRYDKNGWVYLHLEGSPKERGFQYGYLAAKDIKESVYKLSVAWKYKTSFEWEWLVNKAGELFTPKVDAENLAEIDGIVEGMKTAGIQTSRDEIVALNGYMELIWYWWPTVKDSYNSNSPIAKKDACSSFIATGSMTADGKIVLGHNSMVGYEDPFCNVVLDIKPEKGHRILMQAFMGFIHSGTDFFVTDAGLVGSETTIVGFYPFDSKGVPEFSRMRSATQYANTIEEWCEIMKKDNNGGYANSWLLGDINKNEIARLELGLKQVSFEKKTDGFFNGSNIVEDINLMRLETNVDDTNIKNSNIARRVRWKQLLKENAGKINVELAKSFEADHYDPYLKSTTLSQRMLCAHWEYDQQLYTTETPYLPSGTLDGKVLDAKMAKEMSFSARWGSACGTAFDAKKFLEEHPQFYWMKDILRDRPSQPWTIFRAGE